MPNFLGWSKVEKYNSTAEAPIYCRAQLARMGLKPKDESIFEVHRVSSDGYWREYEFFTLDNTIEKRRRTTRELPCTPINLCEALYLLNKSAKKSRDTAQSSYHHSKHGLAKSAKTRKTNLYTLKDAAVKKMVDDGILELKGYHEQTHSIGSGTEISYLLLYQYEDFEFHIPHSARPKDLELLGNITQLISKEATRECSIKFNDGVALLKRYCGVGA